MATKPLYFTSKGAIIVGAALSLIAGVAIGATFVANMIDANSLREYQQNPKIVGFTTLKDNASGNNVGWDPTSGTGRGIDTYVFHIQDSSVKAGSIIYANVIGEYSMRISGGDSSRKMVEVPCIIEPMNGGFDAYCEYQGYPPRDGALLKYIVIASS